MCQCYLCAQQRAGCQRLCLAAGGLCGLQAKGSRLKDTKTPVKQQQADYDMPNTPGSKLGAGMEDGLLSASPEQLPANLMLLHQLLGEHVMQQLPTCCRQATSLNVSAVAVTQKCCPVRVAQQDRNSDEVLLLLLLQVRCM